MAEKTKKPVQLRRRAPEVVRMDRQARGRERNGRLRAATTYLHSVHGSADEDPTEDAELDHEPVSKAIPEHVLEHGMRRHYLAGLSRVHLAISGQCTRDEKVASRWTIRALHTEDLFGIAPSGREVTFSGASICGTDGEFVKLTEPFVNRLGKLIDRKWVFWVIEEWDYWDLPSLVAQLRDARAGGE